MGSVDRVITLGGWGGGVGNRRPGSYIYIYGNIRQVEITAYNLTSWLKQLVPISNAGLIIDINIHYNAQVLSIYSFSKWLVYVNGVC